MLNLLLNMQTLQVLYKSDALVKSLTSQDHSPAPQLPSRSITISLILDSDSVIYHHYHCAAS